MSEYSNIPKSLPSIAPKVSQVEDTEQLALAWEIRPNVQHLGNVAS
jgi:hypothetical protein